MSLSTVSMEKTPIMFNDNDIVETEKPCTGEFDERIQLALADLVSRSEVHYVKVSQSAHEVQKQLRSHSFDIGDDEGGWHRSICHHNTLRYHIFAVQEILEFAHGDGVH
jgi:hypothetical protein